MKARCRLAGTLALAALGMAALGESTDLADVKTRGTLLRGEGDVIAAIFDTPDRREKVAFTTEVIPTHNVAVTLPPRPAISELALASKRVTGLEAGMTVGPPGTVAWAVRKQDTALRGAMDDYLANVRRSPSWSRLVVEYFGDQALAVLGRAR